MANGDKTVQELSPVTKMKTKRGLGVSIRSKVSSAAEIA